MIAVEAARTRSITEIFRSQESKTQSQVCWFSSSGAPHPSLQARFHLGVWMRARRQGHIKRHFIGVDDRKAIRAKQLVVGKSRSHLTFAYCFKA